MAKKTSNQLAEPALLDKVDKLFKCGVGEYVDLPQLVVVGDQSSGKSSVLEGLTKLPFPRDKELCTRFATQITFKRSPSKQITASIVPDSNASDAHKAHVRSWTRPNLSWDLSQQEFGQVILEAQERMGLTKANTDGVKPTFSEDVFKIEKTGPDQDHLSIVDVPGIFRSVEKGKTTTAGRDMVQRMVEGYMENPRSVMLTVVPANVDTATQEILEMATQVDEGGDRTLGVLTKPDLVDEGAEDSVIDLVNGNRYKLKLGWNILRNTGQADMSKSGHDRDDAEMRFFNKEARWARLSPERCGIQNLRVKLQDILARHIKREFPKVRSEIIERLRLARGNLDALGAERQDLVQQRAYLISAAMSFERLTQNSLVIRYTEDAFDQKRELRLPTHVINRQDVFATTMSQFGHAWAWEGKDQSEIPDLWASEVLSNLTKNGKTAPKDMKAREVPDGFSELLHCTLDGSTTVERDPKSGILAWLDILHSESRGFELGSIDPSLLTTSFRAQTEKWVQLSHGYVSDVIALVHKFFMALMPIVVRDERVCEALISRMQETVLDKYKAALAKVDYLLRVERERTPMTANHYFNDTLQKSRRKRMKAQAEKISISQSDPDGNTPQKMVRLDDMDKIDPMSNKEHVIQDFQDVLRSYYKVALKRFVDNVGVQAALDHLVEGPDSPLKIFSPAYVSRLSDDDLADIAGEDPMLKAKRETLLKEIAKLEEGKRIL